MFSWISAFAEMACWLGVQQEYISRLRFTSIKSSTALICGHLRIVVFPKILRAFA